MHLNAGLIGRFLHNAQLGIVATPGADNLRTDAHGIQLIGGLLEPDIIVGELGVFIVTGKGRHAIANQVGEAAAVQGTAVGARLGGAAPRHGVEGFEEWAKGYRGRGDQAETGLDRGPDCDVGCRPEEVVGHSEDLDVGYADDGGYAGEEDEAEDRGDGDLGAGVHLEAPDQSYGQCAENPIAGRGYGRVCIGCIGDGCWVDAGARLSLVLVPEKADGRALEEEEEEVEGRKGQDCRHGAVDDPSVDGLDADSKDEHGDRAAEQGRRHGVEEFAEPPVIEAMRQVLGRNVSYVSARSIFHTAE